VAGTREHLLKAAVRKYDSFSEAIWSNLYILNGNLAILKISLKYQHILGMSPAAEYINFILYNVREYSILVITRLWRGKEGDDCTLPNLRKFTLNNLKKPYKSPFSERMDDLKAEQDLFEKKYFQKLLAHRNKRLAHLDIKHILGGRPTANKSMYQHAREKLFLKDLEQSCNFLNRYFEALDPGARRRFLPITFDEERLVSSNRKSSAIANALDMVALSNPRDWFLKEVSREWKTSGGQISRDTKSLPLMKEIVERNRENLTKWCEMDS